MKKELQEAYKKVIKDLSKTDKCKEYSFGCFGCEVNELRKRLKSFYQVTKDIR